MLDGKLADDNRESAPYITLKDKLNEYANIRARSDFLTFVKIFAPTLVSDFQMGRHIELLCQKLQGVVDGDVKRLMVFLPPRSSKSVICSKLFPAWYIGNNGNHEIMSLSHSEQLASDFGRTVRDVVGTARFQRIFRDISLRSDVKAA